MLPTRLRFLKFLKASTINKLPSLWKNKITYWIALKNTRKYERNLLDFCCSHCDKQTWHMLKESCWKCIMSATDLNQWVQGAETSNPGSQFSWLFNIKVQSQWVLCPWSFSWRLILIQKSVIRLILEQIQTSNIVNQMQTWNYIVINLITLVE